MGCVWSSIVLLEHKVVTANSLNSNWIQNFIMVVNPCQVTWNHDQLSPETCRYSTQNHDTDHPSDISGSQQHPNNVL